MSETETRNTSELCARVRADVERALESDAALLPELQDHVAECDRCRDLVHDVEQAAKLVLRAGDDYRHPVDFSARVLARIDQLQANAGELVGQVEAPPRSARVPRPPAVPERAAAPEAVTAPEPNTAAIVRFFKSRKGRPTLAAMLAAVAVLVLWLGEGRQSGTTVARAPEGKSAEPWQGRVVLLARGFGSGEGLSSCPSEAAEPSDCRRLEQGAEVRAGSVLRTDGLTRARLELADGTHLALDRKTELVLDDDAPRRSRLSRGDAIFDVRRGPPSEDAQVVVEVPGGRIEVLGTKFAVHVDEVGTRVDVSRGEVRLVGSEGRDVAVAAGQSGRLYADSAPEVVANSSLGDAFGWGERAFVKEEAEGDGPRGLGELRAKKPGEPDELRDAVVLTRHSVKVRLQETLARTEVEEVFTNQTDERLEGILRFPLPPDAQIESLALEVDGRFEEGAFVDRERAAAIWRGAIVNSSKRPLPVREEIVWVPGPWKDPALLEWQSGGRFELRIFPIEKRSSRRVRLSYTQKLPASGDRVRYVYPLPHDPSGSTKVANFDFEVEARGHTRSLIGRGYDFDSVSDDVSGVTRRAFSRSDFVPNGDVALEYRLPDAGRELRAWAYRGDGAGGGGDQATVAISIRPELPLAHENRERAYVFVLDRSRSMYGERWARATRLVERAIRELDRGALVRVIDCDSECSEFGSEFRQAGDELADDVARYLSAVQPEGASDLVLALRRASASTAGVGDRKLELVYVGDGAPTVGEIEPGLLGDAVRSLASERVRISALTVGAEADLGALQAVTRAGGGIVIPFEPGQSVAEAAFALLGATYGAALSDVDVTLPPELDDVSPRRFDNVLAGGELLLVARMPRERVEGQVRLRGRVGEEVFERTYDLSLVASAGGGNAFVPRLFAATKIADLEHDSTSEARERVVSLSQRFNVASRYTSLLVLESPAMFKAFGLDNQRTVPLWTGELEAEKSEAGDVLEEQARFDFDDESTDSLGTLGSGGFDSPSSGRGAAGPGDAAKAKKKPAFSSPPASAPERRRSEERASDEFRTEASRDRWPLAENEAPSDSRAFEPLPPVPPSRPMIPMRKIWERQGTISTGSEIPVSDEELATRRARFEQNPLAREALKALYSAYLLRGDLDRAEELATRWSEKDPLDADALTARADLAAERGDRKLALRILGSVVDVRPSDHQALFRLARAYRWAGESERGCRYAFAEAQRRTTHAATVAAAVRCLRDLGERELSQRLLQSVPSNQRNDVDRLAAGNAPLLDELSGDFRVEGTWEASGDGDLDIVIVHPDGYRVSWLGAPTRAVISATDVVSRNREGLALRGAQVGRYAVEVVRSSEAGVGGTQRGELVIRVGSERRTVPFVIEGTRARVATVQVVMRSRLVPL